MMQVALTGEQRDTLLFWTARAVRIILQLELGPGNQTPSLERLTAIVDEIEAIPANKGKFTTS